MSENVKQKDLLKEVEKKKVCHNHTDDGKIFQKLTLKFLKKNLKNNYKNNKEDLNFFLVKCE